jgi:Alpha-kinase family
LYEIANSLFPFVCVLVRAAPSDISGVGDRYTDPQILSADGKGYGRGNLGQKGINKFLDTHRCNAICRYLKLPSINANYENMGTLPTTQYMMQDQIVVETDGDHRIGKHPSLSARTPLLPPRVASQSARYKASGPSSRRDNSDLCCWCIIL